MHRMLKTAIIAVGVAALTTSNGAIGTGRWQPLASETLFSARVPTRSGRRVDEAVPGL